MGAKSSRLPLISQAQKWETGLVAECSNMGCWHHKQYDATVLPPGCNSYIWCYLCSSYEESRLAEMKILTLLFHTKKTEYLLGAKPHWRSWKSTMNANKMTSTLKELKAKSGGQAPDKLWFSLLTAYLAHYDRATGVQATGRMGRL